METENTRLKQLRTELELSLDQLGKSLGMSKSGLSSLESGHRKVSDKHIKLIKAAYPTINENWIRTGEGEMLFTSVPSVDDITNGAIVDELDTKLIQCYLNLSTDDRQTIKEYLASVFQEDEAEISEEERWEQEAREEAERIYQELLAEKRAKAKSSDLDELLQA